MCGGLSEKSAVKCICKASMRHYCGKHFDVACANLWLFEKLTYNVPFLQYIRGPECCPEELEIKLSALS